MELHEYLQRKAGGSKPEEMSWWRQCWVATGPGMGVASRTWERQRNRFSFKVCTRNEPCWPILTFCPPKLEENKSMLWCVLIIHENLLQRWEEIDTAYEPHDCRWPPCRHVFAWESSGGLELWFFCNRKTSALMIAGGSQLHPQWRPMARNSEISTYGGDISRRISKCSRNRKSVLPMTFHS